MVAVLGSPAHFRDFNVTSFYYFLNNDDNAILSQSFREKIIFLNRGASASYHMPFTYKICNSGLLQIQSYLQINLSLKLLSACYHSSKFRTVLSGGLHYGPNSASVLSHTLISQLGTHCLRTFVPHQPLLFLEDSSKLIALAQLLIFNFLFKARFPLPELTGDRFPLPVNTSRVDGRAFPLAELTARQLGQWKPHARQHCPVMETGHLSNRVVNLGSGNRALLTHGMHTCVHGVVGGLQIIVMMMMIDV